MSEIESGTATPLEGAEAKDQKIVQAEQPGTTTEAKSEGVEATGIKLDDIARELGFNKAADDGEGAASEDGSDSTTTKPEPDKPTETEPQWGDERQRDDGNREVYTVVDGKGGWVSYKDVVKAYQTNRHLTEKAQRLAEQEKANKTPDKGLEQAEHSDYESLFDVLPKPGETKEMKRPDNELLFDDPGEFWKQMDEYIEAKSQGVYVKQEQKQREGKQKQQEAYEKWNTAFNAGLKKNVEQIQGFDPESIKSVASQLPEDVYMRNYNSPQGWALLHYQIKEGVQFHDVNGKAIKMPQRTTLERKPQIPKHEQPRAKQPGSGNAQKITKGQMERLTNGDADMLASILEAGGIK